MNHYIATIRVNGQSIKTSVFADSAIHARLILQFQFGMNCLVSSPVLWSPRIGLKDAAPISEVIKMIKPVSPLSSNKPLSPEKVRLAQLKKASDNAKNIYQAERERQGTINAQRKIFNLSRP